ncbi:MAG: hypothetical protein L3J35_01595 [Bacteroidales bacterium]|nr:hypothetical protein [Bacteroidales bacterium]
MKKTAILLSLLITLSFSCDKRYKFYAFYIEKTVDVEFAAGTVGDFDLTQSVEIYIDNLLTKEGTEAELIEEVTIEEASLSENNFNRFNSLELFISADGLTEIPLAKSDTTNLYESKVLLNGSKEKMDEYIKASTFSIKTTGQLSSSEAQTFKIPVYLRFLVKTYVK